MTDTVLRIDTSARRDGSISRQLTDRVIDKLAPRHVITRDLATPLPHVDERWIGANFTPARIAPTSRKRRWRSRMT